MPKFRKKPVEVEAVQFNGSTADIHEFCGIAVREPAYKNCLEIFTDGIWYQAYKNDWIVKDENGYSVCEPDIFEKTYEVVEATQSSKGCIVILKNGRAFTTSIQYQELLNTLKECDDGEGMFLKLNENSNEEMIVKISEISSIEQINETVSIFENCYSDEVLCGGASAKGESHLIIAEPRTLKDFYEEYDPKEPTPGYQVTFPDGMVMWAPESKVKEAQKRFGKVIKILE